MSNFLDCEYCEKRVDCNENYEQYQAHVRACDMRPVMKGDIEDLEKKVAEMHEFVSMLAGALNNPMLKAMIPPQYRGMLGG